MWPFKEGGGSGRRPARSSRPSRDRIPTDRVITLSSQGVSEPEIIQTLKVEGYTPLQVDQAMKEALKSSVGTTGPEPPPVPAPSPYSEPAPPLPPPVPESGLSPPQRRPEELPGLPPLPTETELPPPPISATAYTYPEPEPPVGPSLPGEGDISRLREPMTRREAKDEKRRALEELAESIIEEKWISLREDIMNLKAQVQELGMKTSSIEQSMIQLRGEKKTDMQKIEEKIDTYKESINEVSAKMGAIENAMKESLSPMMQSMRSMTETIREMKEKK